MSEILNRWLVLGGIPEERCRWRTNTTDCDSTGLNTCALVALVMRRRNVSDRLDAALCCLVLKSKW